MTKEFPHPMDIPWQINLLLVDTIDVKMDPYNDEKIIKIGKFLEDNEKHDHSTLLHEFPEIFSWTYLDMPYIDPKVMTHNIVSILMLSLLSKR